MPRRIVILANRRVVGRRRFQRVRRALDAQGSTLCWGVEGVSGPDDVQRVVDGLEPEVIPVAAGGDGTVSMVATALHRAGTRSRPFGVLPLGTGNLLARDLHLGTPELAVRALVAGAPAPVDVMRTDREDVPLALVSLSAGFEAAFLSRYEKGRRFGRLAGAMRGLWTARGRREVKLMADGRVLTPTAGGAYVAGLYNTRCYVGGVVMSPRADPTDGVAEAVAYPTARRYWSAVALGALTDGGPEPRGEWAHWRHAEIEAEESLQVDGEPRPGGAVSVELLAGGLTILKA